MKRLLITLLSGATVALMASPASASLVYNSQIQLSAQGFGTAPRDLTVQQRGNSSIESGCVGISGNAIAVGSCMGTDAAFDPNGVINVGGDEPNPQTDAQKYGIPTAASLGILSAADVPLPQLMPQIAANIARSSLRFAYVRLGQLGTLGQEEGDAEVWGFHRAVMAR